MSGKRSRNKGAAWEREVANLLQEATGVECSRRVRQYQVGGSDIETELPLAVECKTGYRVNTMAALEQAIASAEPNKMPLVWVKQNRGTPKPPARYVVMPEAAFLELVALAGL